MAQDRDNCKLPQDPISNNQIDPKYGYVHGEWDACGGHNFTYRNPEEDTKTYHQVLSPSGKYKTIEHNDKKKELVTELNVGETRGYTKGGKSTHVDGHTDSNHEATFRIETAKDYGNAIKGDRYIGINGKEIKYTKEGTTRGHQGSSFGTNDITDKASHRKTVDGDNQNHVKGHDVHMSEKNYLHVVQEEMGVHSGGNQDYYSDKKYHVFSKDAFIANTDSTFDTWSKQDMTMHSEAKGNFNSKGDMTIESDSKITIKVGSSKITITSSKITIEATQIEVKASGSNALEGHPLNFNGGGPSSPPFTVP